MKYYEPRYPLVNLPFPVALDTYLIQKYITEHRHLIGNNNYRIQKYSNSISNNKIEESALFLSDINSKLDNEFYNDITSTSYINTINYIYHYIKVGIYVRIVNSTLLQFVPIFNYSPNDDGLIIDNAENLQFTIPNVEDESGEEVPVSF